MFAVSADIDRVRASTDDAINRVIDEIISNNILYYRQHPEGIDARLRELDEEWDIERVLEINASTLALAGLGLGMTLSRAFLALPALMAGFLWQHAVYGWCPPLPFFRARGYRTRQEIDRERTALLQIRTIHQLIPTSCH